MRADLRKLLVTGILHLLLSVTLVPTAVGSILTPGGEPDPSFESNSMALWLRADAGLTESSGTVTAWADQSNHSRAITVSGSPSFVGSGIGSQPSVGFDGTDDEFSHGTDFIGAADFTYFAVFNTNSSASQDIIGTGHSDLRLTGGFLDGRIWNGSYPTDRH